MKNYKKKFSDYYNIKIKLLLSNYDKHDLKEHSSFIANYYELEPRSNFTTPWCSNILSVLKKCGIDYIDSIEYSIRYNYIDAVPKYDKMLYTCRLF